MGKTNIQQHIIDTLHTIPQIDVDREIRQRVNFIKEYMNKCSVKTTVLGLSGGVDSSLAGRLAQIAVDELNTENQTIEYQFIAMRLPYDVQLDEADAQTAVQFVKPSKLYNVNIKSIVDATSIAVHDSYDEDYHDHHLDFTRGNVKARVRMLVQFKVANLQNGLVIGTDHSAEALTGFFTKFGDGACDIAPLFGLNKRQIRLLAKTLGAPETIAQKVATADLEDLNPQLADEDSLGISYDDIDDYLEGKAITADIQQKLETRYQQTEHKRQGPVTPYDDWWKTL